ncbi:MAG: ribosomal L7Ae/L30e/S12e/Gadd45 family protein [Eubacterium sp.]|nr:ribosomal L7Ae/L30e/S12e/Gadd45 family protein [Eubacterium sp.]
MSGSKVLSLLGLARKAGFVKSGEFSSESLVKSGKAYLVLLASDASDNTKKKFTDMCRYYEVPVRVLDCTKEELGKCIGQEMRTSAAVSDEGFAKAILKRIQTD